MIDQPVIVLPPLFGGQAESWAALIELAPAFGHNWLLVGGQMVFLHELERNSTEVRPTDDIDVVVDLRAEPAGLARIHAALISANLGLEYHAAHEVRNSELIATVEQRNRVHRHHRSESFESLRHVVITFHDETLECVCRSRKSGPLEADFGAAVTAAVDALRTGEMGTN